jgi:hypothetical protein
MSERVGEDVMQQIGERNKVAARIVELREEQARIETRIHGLLSEDLGSTTATLRYGPWIVRIRETDWKHTINNEGQDALAGLVVKSDRLVRRLFNLNSPSRWAAMRDILDDYWEGGWQSFDKQFVEWEEKPVATAVQFIPEEKAPKFAQALEDGEAVIR